jgi:DNA end-binding protein Ku
MGKATKIAVVKPASTPAPNAPEKATKSIKLVLQVGLIVLPIKLSTGARAEKVAFTKLHGSCRTPLKMQGGSAGTMYCPCCSEYIAPDNIVKGFEQSKGSYVLVTAEEIAAQKPDTEKLVEVDMFVDAAEIDPIYFQESYYISPDDGGAKAFLLVREALRKTRKVAIGKATLFGNEHTVIIRPFGDGLALHLMYHQTELNLVHYPADTTTISEGELKLAGQLIDSMSGKFDASRYSDRYLANIHALVASKAAGQAVPQIVRKTAKPAMDLMGALAASVKAAKERKAA